jgi:lysophospholipase L1-like esterase
VQRWARLFAFIGWAATALAAALMCGAGAHGQCAPSAARAAQAEGKLPAPVHLTSEQDHQRMLGLLHIDSLRRGPDGDPKSPNAANVDESKVDTTRKLPDPLILKNGKKVETATVWWEERRPEIVEDFDREVFGRIPSNTPNVDWEVLSTTRETIGSVAAITKKLLGHVDNSAYPLVKVDIQLAVTVPANATGPVPAMMELSISPEILAMIKGRMTAEQWKALQEAGPTWQEQVLAKGWGYAIYLPTSVQADNGEGLTQGIIGLVNKGQPRKLEDWGVLKAWAWGASRALDYLETDKAVDAKQVGVEGLSRYGKAALVAMAYDPRFAIGFIASSGEGGAKILRRNFGEQVENLAAISEYHWMDGNFLKYAGPLTPNDLPVDAHELIALCAPRPVFVSSGSLQVEGGWIDGKGMFLGAVGAGPVYKLLGKRDLGTTEFPPMETRLLDGDIAFRQHRGGHTAGPNWPTFLQFASRYLGTGLGGHWVGSWATGQAGPAKDPTEFANQTLRLIVHLSAGGERVRIRISNTFGMEPLTIGAAHVAISADKSSKIVADSDRRVTFSGNKSFTIPAGAMVLSDPIELKVAPLSDLAVSIYLPQKSAATTTHFNALQRSYVGKKEGDETAAIELKESMPTTVWDFLTGIDVERSRSERAIVAFGDSITDGGNSEKSANHRWPDALAERLQHSEGGQNVAVLNVGVIGNRLLHPSESAFGNLFAPAGLARLDRDVLSQAGVRYLVVLLGINDIGHPGGPAPVSESVSAEEIIAGYLQVIARAHEKGIRAYGGTLTPFENTTLANFYSPAKEEIRQKVNQWIRRSGAFDAVIDFEEAIRDPEHPTRMRAEFDCGDHLHPNDAGLKAMAEKIDLGLFQ